MYMILSQFVKIYIYAFILFYLLAMPHSMQDLSPLTRG